MGSCLHLGALAAATPAAPHFSCLIGVSKPLRLETQGLRDSQVNTRQFAQDRAPSGLMASC